MPLEQPFVDGRVHALKDPFATAIQHSEAAADATTRCRFHCGIETATVTEIRRGNWDERQSVGVVDDKSQ